MSIVLADRRDRLGSNFVVKMGTFINGKISNAKIYHNRSMKFYDSIFMKPFIENTIEKNDDVPVENDITKYPIYFNGIRGHQGSASAKMKQDLISYFKDNLKEDFFDHYSGFLICEY